MKPKPKEISITVPWEQAVSVMELLNDKYPDELSDEQQSFYEHLDNTIHAARCERPDCAAKEAI